MYSPTVSPFEISTFGRIGQTTAYNFPQSMNEDDKTHENKKETELPSTVALLRAVGHPRLQPSGSRPDFSPFLLRSHSLLHALVKGQTKEAPNLPSEP